MEIDIRSKKNNPLFNRTEVHFVIRHDGEKTPSRDIVRNDLAEKLNVKKENVLVHRIKTGFGSAETVGYAKVYSSIDKTNGLERKYVIKRNNASGGEGKQKKKEKPAEDKSSEEKPEGEKVKEDDAEQDGTQEKKPEEKSSDEKTEELEDKKDDKGQG